MSLSVGIVGLPNVGKSTLFNALLKKRVALSANYPFATIEPNVGVVAVPDERLLKLAELVKNEEHTMNLPPLVPAAIEFVDIAGLVKGASQGAGLGNQFLSHIREVDAIVHVLRDFPNPDIIREGSENPETDKTVVETELALADLQTLGKLIAGQETLLRQTCLPARQGYGGQGKTGSVEEKKLSVLNKIKEALDKGKTNISLADFFEGADEKMADWFVCLPLLALKPALYVRNVAEEEYKEKLFASLSENEIVISAKLEEELADYSEEERVAYLKEMGIEKTGLERLVVKAYSFLGLISYLTAGVKEIRAWTIKKETKAPKAAAAIHTDFEKGFIRAQVIEYEKLIGAGSYAAAKERGLVRTEGKDYKVKDGDVIEFLVHT